ncbi:MAG: hypothetical protein ACI83W_002706 [Marinoscillum sp.]|jgi:hypothetical protein
MFNYVYYPSDRPNSPLGEEHENPKPPRNLYSYNPSDSW